MAANLDTSTATERDPLSVQKRDIFSVPLITCTWHDSAALNADLRDVILKMMRGSPGTVKTNRRGWQSTSDFHLVDQPCVREIVSRIFIAVREMVLCITPEPDEQHLHGWRIQACWANVNPPGGYNRPHHHDGPKSHLSGFYYVDFGDDRGAVENRGNTYFENRSGIPRPNRASNEPKSYETTLSPSPGTMTMFPASSYHYVEPYSGATQRISIAFNVYHPDFRVVYYDGMREPSFWWHNFRGLMLLPRKIPEKLLGLSLVPRMIAASAPRADGLSSWPARARVAVSSAFAEASARFERRSDRRR